MSEIKDSGTRREFETSAVRDCAEGKGRCDLLPLDVLAEAPGDGVDMVLWGVNKFIRERDVYSLYSALMRFCMAREWDIRTMALEVAIHMEECGKKYPERNWEKGIPLHSYVDSMVRHYLKWRRGDEDEPHDRSFCWNALACLWTVKNKPEMDDLPGDRRATP